ncbi:hypothetical protein Hanom_Chr14g01270051 [Helianthus anomalus]
MYVCVTLFTFYNFLNIELTVVFVPVFCLVVSVQVKFQICIIFVPNILEVNIS